MKLIGTSKIIKRTTKREGNKHGYPTVGAPAYIRLLNLSQFSRLEKAQQNDMNHIFMFNWVDRSCLFLYSLS